MAEEIKCEICDRIFGGIESLVAHNKAKHPEKIPKEKNQLPVKKIKNWTIFAIVLGMIFYGIFWLIGNINSGTVINEEDLNFESPKGAIHWHPTLTIKINDEIQKIPPNIGITNSVHFPIHTHEDADVGVIHMENDRPTKKTVTLGYFFGVWGKKFSGDCIFDYCRDKGELKMYVNEEENFEFEKYFMQDKDNILIEYNSFN